MPMQAKKRTQHQCRSRFLTLLQAYRKTRSLLQPLHAAPASVALATSNMTVQPLSSTLNTSSPVTQPMPLVANGHYTPSPTGVAIGQKEDGDMQGSLLQALRRLLAALIDRNECCKGEVRHIPSSIPATCSPSVHVEGLDLS